MSNFGDAKEAKAKTILVGLKIAEEPFPVS
jgi:hypothetical protein